MYLRKRPAIFGSSGTPLGIVGWKVDQMGKRSMPKVSIIMAAFNVEGYISAAIESCLSQTFEDFELLIHDDGSSDRTLDIAKSYEARDRRIQVTSSSNLGPSAARNIICNRARGEYLAILDADDECLPNRLELQKSFLDRNLDYVLVGGQIHFMEEDGSVVGPVFLPTDHEEIDANHMMAQCKVYHSTVMMRTSAFLEVGGYNVQLPNAEDYDLWLRMAELGKLINLESVVARYRLRESSLSGQDYKGQTSFAWRACALARERRGLPPIDAGAASETREVSPLLVSDWRRTVQFGWIAWSGGLRKSWRRYALRSLREAPLEPESWRLVLFGFFKRPNVSDKPRPFRGQ